MTDDFVKRVVAVAKHKYELDEDVLEEYLEVMQECWYNGFSARRTVEVIAEKIF